MISALGLSRQVVKRCDRRFLSSASDWESSFRDAVDGMPMLSDPECRYEAAAGWLRDSVVKPRLIEFTDVKTDPARFFKAHRIISSLSPQTGPGAFIRFTVHYNLFGGTVVGCGTPEQVESLDEMYSKGELGCFALTEKLAGVNSGLLVNTTADYDPATQTFRVNTPDVGSQKNWISQGFVADKTVVVADLTVGGTKRGPHAFLMDLRKNGDLVSGVSIVDMGRKTVGNDLDNAAIKFEDVQLPKSALLSRFCEMQGDEYHMLNPGVHPMTMLGQRLFTGRVAVAQASLEFLRTLYARTKAYSDEKMCWMPDGNVPLSAMPQLAALYSEAADSQAQMDSFCANLEAKLSEHLVSDTLPSASLIEHIAVAKIQAVRTSIALTHRLENEVGSYALMSGQAGFENAAFLQCCNFAEGDGRILSLKLARDRMRRFEKEGAKLDDAETRLCSELGTALKSGGTWASEWDTVFALSDAIIDRVVEQEQ